MQTQSLLMLAVWLMELLVFLIVISFVTLYIKINWLNPYRLRFNQMMAFFWMNVYFDFFFVNFYFEKKIQIFQKHHLNDFNGSNILIWSTENQFILFWFEKSLFSALYKQSWTMNWSRLFTKQCSRNWNILNLSIQFSSFNSISKILLICLQLTK